MKKICLFLSLLIAFSALSSEDTIEVVNIENRAVQDYMAHAARVYPNTDYSVSVIVPYNSNTEKYGRKLFWPQGKQVSWTTTASPDDIKEVRISLSEKSNFAKAMTFNPDKESDTSFIIRNMLPNRLYYYKVEQFLYDGSHTLLTSGRFRTVGQVRMIRVHNVSNVRDLGGWPTQYGVPVQYGRLFRSANLDKINAEGIHDFVDNLGVVAELDLRRESKLTASPMGDNIDYLLLPHGAYLSGITKRKDVYVTDMRWIIARLREGKNVDWHCAVGCDRCGTLSFLLEGLLGVSELDLCRDYELSTFMMPSKNKRERKSLEDMFPHIRSFGPDDDLAQCFYNYWRSLGLEKSELDYFMRVMLDMPNIAKITSKYQMPDNQD